MQLHASPERNAASSASSPASRWEISLSVSRRGDHQVLVARVPLALMAELRREELNEDAVRVQMRGSAAEGLEILLGEHGVKPFRGPGRPSISFSVAPSHYGVVDDPIVTRRLTPILERRGAAIIAKLPPLPDLAAPVAIHRVPHWHRPAAAEYARLTTIDATPPPPQASPEPTRLPARPASAPVGHRPDRFNPALPARITFPKAPDPEDQPAEPAWRVRMRQWEAAEAPPKPASNGHANGHAGNGAAKPSAAPPPTTKPVTATPPALYDAKYSQPIDASVRSEVLTAVEMLNSALDRDKSGLIVVRLHKNRVSVRKAAITLTEL